MPQEKPDHEASNYVHFGAKIRVNHVYFGTIICYGQGVIALCKSL